MSQGAEQHALSVFTLNRQLDLKTRSASALVLLARRRWFGPLLSFVPYLAHRQGPGATSVAGQWGLRRGQASSKPLSGSAVLVNDSPAWV